MPLHRFRELIRAGTAPGCLHQASCPAFGGKGGGGSTVIQPPPPVDPIAQANAEAMINRFNIVSPFGTQTWTPPAAGSAGAGQTTPDSYDAWLARAYPRGVPTTYKRTSSDSDIEVPRDVRPEYDKYLREFVPAPAGPAGGSPQWTQTQTLTPSQQRQFDARNAVAEQLLERAGRQVPQIPADPFKFGAQDPTITSFVQRLKAMSDNPFAPGLDGSAVRNAMYAKQTGLLDPHFRREEERLDQKLANQGLPMGGQAFKADYGDFARARDLSYERAALDAVMAGAAEEQNQFGRALSQRQQAVGEAQTGFNAAMSADQDARARALAERQQNYNELAALLGGQQLNALPAGGGGAVDVSGAFNRAQAAQNTAYQARMQGYAADVGYQNAGLGAAAMIAASFF